MEVKRVKDWVKEIDFLHHWPFIGMHLSVLLVFWSGTSLAAVLICIGAFFIRMFGITAGYHRYFSHRSFQTSRPFQFFLAFLGASSTQMGPLWWAAHHRHHHRHSDEEPDVHSPIIDTFLWSHIGWIMAKDSHNPGYEEKVADLAVYPEIRWIDKNFKVAGLAMFLSMCLYGYLIERFLPSWHTTAAQVIVWGFFVSTVLLYHGTFCINSLTHVWGSRRYKTTDDSRNNFLLSLITLGEGWHNNHHAYCGASKMGFFWWEIDVTYYILKMLSWFHIVWDLKQPPKQAYQ